MWEIRSIILPGTTNIIVAPLCNASDTCIISAASGFMTSSSDTNDPDYGCPQQCSATDFIVEKSSLLAPMEWQMPDIRNFVEKSSIPLSVDWLTSWREQIHNNYVVISVERQSVVVENKTQTATLSLVDVLSNIGGQSGLWIGISLLSIMELIEMFYRLLRHEFHVRRMARQREVQIMAQKTWSSRFSIIHLSNVFLIYDMSYDTVPSHYLWSGLYLMSSNAMQNLAQNWSFCADLNG